MDDLHAVEEHLATLSRQVEPDLHQKAQLRQELMRRHRELTAGTTQRAAGWLKRLTLVAPPALAGIVALAFILLGFPPGGRPSAQSVEAARISRALARTAPTVTAWQVTVQQQHGDSALSAQCSLQHQHLFVRGDHVYVYVRSRWYEVTATWQGNEGQCPADLQWAFAALPGRLARHDFSILPDAVIRGYHTTGIRYTLSARGRTVDSTVWVDRQTGLILRAQEVVRSGNRVVEQDHAEYSYTRSS